MQSTLQLDQKTIKSSDKITDFDLNTYFESYLAIKLASHRELLPIVDVISEIIIGIIQKRKEEITKILNENDNLTKLQEELYVQFGTLTTKKLNVDVVLEDIQSALECKKASLVNIMPIHGIFGYRILRLLNEKKYEEIRKNFKEANTYIATAKNCVTKNDEKTVKPTAQLGVSRSPIICQKINEMPEVKEILERNAKVHKTSLERFNINLDKEAIKDFITHNVPLAAGPSSHTLALMTAAKLYEIEREKCFTIEELNQYKTAYFIYLGTAGFHTFYEVESVFRKCFDLPCDMSQYRNHLPDSIKSSTEFSELEKLFPEQLIQKSTESTSISIKGNNHLLFKPHDPSSNDNLTIELRSSSQRL